MAETNIFTLACVSICRDEDETSDSDSFHDPPMNITEDVQLLHGLPVSKSG